MKDNPLLKRLNFFPPEFQVQKISSPWIAHWEQSNWDDSSASSGCLRNDELFDKHIMICFFAVAWIFKLKLNNFNLI